MKCKKYTIFAHINPQNCRTMATKNPNIIKGHILDVVNRCIIDGNVHIKDGKIHAIVPLSHTEKDLPYIMPGFIDAHVHIESSMLTPSHFADAAVRHGVIGCVCDPHEIANVCGIEGINYMIRSSKQRNFRFAFALPSCVPATSFETSGFCIDSGQISELIQSNDFVALAEMMNFPGVLHGDKETMRKIEAARNAGKPIDGHAPMLSGNDLKKYIAAGITTDHECSSLQEAEEKIHQGMKILIREGSAAKNFETLSPLIEKFSDMTMFCSDDCHPDELISGYIDCLVKRSLQKGYPIWNVLRTSSLNPVMHYRLNAGLLQKGDAADFIVIDNLQDFNVIYTFINGECVYDRTKGCAAGVNNGNNAEKLPNNFCASPLTEADISVRAESSQIKVIKAYDKELFTQQMVCNARINDGNIVSDTANDVLKLVVYNRYTPAKPAVGFINGFNLKNGALASTVAHDSHNIIALGTDDRLIIQAINLLIETKGGICGINNQQHLILPLPAGGLMSGKPVETVAKEYQALNDFAKSMGCSFNAPFMTMAFTALLVIPELKLSDKGLFDVNKFAFTSLTV